MSGGSLSSVDGASASQIEEVTSLRKCGLFAPLLNRLLLPTDTDDAVRRKLFTVGMAGVHVGSVLITAAQCTR